MRTYGPTNFPRTRALAIQLRADRPHVPARLPSPEGGHDRAVRISAAERFPNGRPVVQHSDWDLTARRQGAARGRALAASTRRFAGIVQRSAAMNQLTPLMRTALIFADGAYRSSDAMIERLAGMVARGEWRESPTFTRLTEQAHANFAECRGQWHAWLAQPGFQPEEEAMLHLLYTSWAQTGSTMSLYYMLARPGVEDDAAELVARLRSPLIEVKGSVVIVALATRARRELARALIDDLRTRAKAVHWTQGGNELRFEIDLHAKPRAFGYKSVLQLPSPPRSAQHPFWSVIYHFAGFAVRMVEDGDDLSVALRWQDPNIMVNYS